MQWEKGKKREVITHANPIAQELCMYNNSIPFLGRGELDIMIRVNYTS